MKSLRALLTTALSILTLQRTATVTGATVDMANFASNKAVFVPGVLTDGVHTPSVTESDAAASGFTAVAAADLDGALAVLASNVPQSVGYIGSKRYLRLVITTTGGPATGLNAGAHVEQGNSRKVP